MPNINTIRALLIGSLVLFIASRTFAAGSCEEVGYGKCYKVHARYTVYTGDGQIALWPVGTHRLLYPASGAESLYTSSRMTRMIMLSSGIL